MITVQCWVCHIPFDVYPSRYRLCKWKRFFCKRTCKDSASAKPLDEKRETKRACNHRARIKKYAKRRAQLDAIKLESGCIDCGYKEHPAALQFDHRELSEKEFEIGRNILHKPWDVLLAEIAKCDVRCANCHAIRTAKMQASKWIAESNAQHCNQTPEIGVP